MSQVVETNKTIIKRYFEAYNTKNEAIFDEIIGPDYIDHGQSAYMLAWKRSTTTLFNQGYQ